MTTNKMSLTIFFFFFFSYFQTKIMIAMWHDPIHNQNICHDNGPPWEEPEFSW